MSLQLLLYQDNFFTTLVGMGSRSYDFDDEFKISFLISSSVARSKTFILDLIFGFCTDGILCTSSANLERIVSINIIFREIVTK